jgi:hypothetical protein
MFRSFTHSSLLLALTTVPALVATAQSGPLVWSEPIVVARSSQDLMRPRIVLNAEQRPVIMWGAFSPAANWAAVGEGNSFSIPQLIHPEGFQATVADWQGSDLAAHGDVVHAVVKRLPESTGGVYLITSMDGGYSWGDTVRVDQVPGYKTRFSSVAVNALGQPLVQFMRIDPGEADHRYMVARMVDGQFQEAVDVSTPFTAGEDCDCCAGELVSGGDDVVALFRDATNNLRVIWAAASSNGGADFPQAASVDHTQWVLGACPASGPDGYVAGDSIRVVWMSGALNGTKAHLRSAHLTDLASGMPRQVHPGQLTTLQQNHPRIAGSGDTLAVVWQQTFQAQSEVLFAWSITGIHGLSEPDTVNVELAGPQRMPDIAYANGTFHLTWSDLQANTIMYRSVTLGQGIGMAEHGGLPTLAIRPVPADRELFLPTDVEEHPAGALVVLDASGRTVLQQPVSRTVDVSVLAVGQYTLLLRDRNGSPVARSRFTVVR